jgi:phage terminase large subunit-like protein
VGLSLAEQAASRALTLSPEELSELEHDWEFWSRPEQREPEGDWLTWLILAGRGFGKTRAGAEAVRRAVTVDGCRRVALVGATSADARDVMVLGESGILNVFPEHERPKYEASKRRVLFRNGAIATCYSAEEPDRLRGPQHDFAWCDEFAAWGRLEQTWADLQMGLRLGGRPRTIITTTPRPLDLLKELVEQSTRPGSGVVVTRGRTRDNAANLPRSFIDTITRAYGSTRLGRQELDGEILGPASGLFKAEWFRYLPEAPAGGRCVVAVDPAITTRNDETGIVVTKRVADRAYVLEDLSGTHSPEEWARIAVDACRRHRASTIVAETNRGGDLVRTTIRQFDRAVPIKEVRANRGKDTRAEPVAALYEQGRVFHCGQLRALEKQLTEWDPTSQDAQRQRRQATSPDRLDALVWGITELGFHLGLSRLAPLREAPSITHDTH